MRLINADTLPNYEVDVIARVGDAAGPAKMRFVLWDDIQKAPVIDLVRCGECKWIDVCKVNGYYNGKNGFCSKGKRADAKEG